MFVILPSSVRMLYVIVFATLLCMMEVIQGTTPFVAGCVFVYLVLAALAFNIAGGFEYPSGAFIFFNTLLTFILGLGVKLVLWEPVEANLHNPRKSILVYIGGLAGMLFAAAFSRRLRFKVGIVQRVVPRTSHQRIASGCFALGVFLVLIMFSLGHEDGGVGSAIGQLNHFVPLSILLGVYYRVKDTNGRSSFSMAALLAAILSFLQGINEFSKQGMFTPWICWIIAATAAGYRATTKQMIAFAVFCFIAVGILVPYSQVVRGREDRDTLGGPIDKLIYVATNFSEIREQHRGLEERQDMYHWFNTSQGVFDRLNMIAMDDALIELTDTDHMHGLSYVGMYFYNILPHAVAPDKPTIRFGNEYAHELGMLAADDNMTGISFSPTGDAYHIYSWLGVLLIMPAILCVCFWMVDSASGSLRQSPWGLYFVLTFAHQASEGMLGGPILAATNGVVILVFAVVMTTYVAPIVGTLLLGPEKSPLNPIDVVPPVIRRLQS